MAAELGKVCADQRHFSTPSLQVHAEQPGDIRRGNIKSLGIQIRGLGKPANRRIHRVRLTVAALENPLQHPAVLAVSGPEEFAVVAGAEPVYVKNPGQLCTDRKST